MNDIAPTHVKEGTVTMDAGEMRCDSAAAPEPLDVACARAPIGLLAEASLFGLWRGRKWGFLGAWFLYYKRTDLPARMARAAGGLYSFALDKFKVDEFYGAAVIRPIVLVSTNILWKGIDATLIDGTVNESAAGARDISDGVRRMQSGNIRSYAGWVAFGAAVVIAFMVWKGVR